MDYVIGECVFDGRKTRVLRARGADGAARILKQLRGLYPSPAMLARFTRELEITKAAADDGVIEAHELFAREGTVALVLEDFGACSLLDARPAGPWPIDELLDVGAKLADALAGVHRKDIVHKDVNPSNVVWNRQAGVVKLIDFGISQVLEREAARPAATFEGTPGYMSPEQTGRMNRVIDCRSDLYSLGATLYRLATGQLPFPSIDRLELVHAHIARTPPAPHEVDRRIPRAVSDVIMTLLAKRAEDRYQSAAGVAHDLRECRGLAGRRPGAGSAGAFVARARDVDERLRIPQKLYGRDAEVATLLEAFERSATGATGVLLVAGYSGIGKTSLVHEVHRALVGRRGSFVEGKFDQFNRGTPYDSLIQAFRDLARQILTESEERVRAWRARVLSALEGNGRVLTEVIPEFEHLIGPQPAVEELGPEEARNRFQQVMAAFVRSAAAGGDPLVIFLDDLQWADLPSIELIGRLATDPETRHVLFIGAFRDNEVTDTHPLMAAVSQMRDGGARVDTVELGPLGEEDVVALVADTVGRAPGYVRLAVDCHAKTRGNAFFINRFLEQLHDDGLLSFDSAVGHWVWDGAAIRSQVMMENVVDFLSRSIKRLGGPARESLEHAACIGSAFDLETLAVARDATRQETLDGLREALRAELVVPSDEGFWYVERVDEEHTNFGYRFAHDRVQQAAHALVGDDRAARIHLRVGRHLLERLDRSGAEQPERHPRLFDVVEHLNHGAGLMDGGERGRLRQLNLAAGQRAMASAAFAPALGYFGKAFGLSREGAWEGGYAETFTLHVEGARAAYLSGDHATMEERVAAAIAHGRCALDRARALEVKIHALVSQQRFHEAVETALEVVEKLGVTIPKQADPADVEGMLVATLARLHDHDLDRVMALPELDDPEVVAVMRVLGGIMSSAYLAVPGLLPLLACHIVQATLDRGVAKESVYGFTILALVLTAIGKVDLAYAVSRLSLGMLRRWDNRAVQVRNLHVAEGMVGAYVDPLRVALLCGKRVYQLGIATGDLEYACWGLHTMCGNSFYAGVELPAVAAMLAEHLPVIEHHRQRQAAGCTYQFAQMVKNLTGFAEDPARLIGPDYDERTVRKELEAARFHGAAFILNTLGTVTRYLFGELAEARAHADSGKELMAGATATYHVVWWHQFRALAILGGIGAASSDAARAQALADAAPDLAHLEMLCGFSSVNHRHRVELLEAEKARVEGRLGDATEGYDRAIAASRANGFTHEEALANELACRFHLARGSRTAGRGYLLEALYAYSRWGALAKKARLEEEFRELMAGVRLTQPSAVAGETTSSTTSESGSDTLDLDSLFRAATAISSEMRLESLVDKILDVTVKNAGATRGFLIMEVGGGLRIEAAKDADGASLDVLGKAPERCAELSAGVVAYVARTGESVVVTDARLDPRTQADPRVSRHNPTSILCVPVVYQGERSGIVYLENDLTAGAFTPARRQVIDLLAAQAAISIANARLYADLNRSLEVQVELTNAHRRFVPNQFLESLGHARIDAVKLGDSVHKEMTVLFSDMRGFATLVEKMSSEESIAFINAYLRHMEPPISRHGGFVDSYIGDAIMALFDEPYAAIQAGIGMFEALRGLNGERARTGLPPLAIGIGVNTGGLTLGTIGGPHRIKCGVIGDCVNVASRVEALTKRYGTPFLTTDVTLQRLGAGEPVRTRIVDRVVVLGRHQPVTLYEVCDADPEPLLAAKLRTLERFEEGVAHYYARRFDDARRLLDECRAELGADPVVASYLRRAARYAEAPPGEGWTGVEVLEHK